MLIVIGMCASFRRNFHFDMVAIVQTAHSKKYLGILGVFLAEETNREGPKSH